MCQYISFFHRPDNGDIAVYDLTSHSKTQQYLKLNLNLWCEGHYTPQGEIVCRVGKNENITELDCNERLRAKYSTFADFAHWCIDQNKIVASENIYLSGLTSAVGLVLPTSIGGGLYLSGLTSAVGLVLPTSIGSELNLSGLTSAEKEKTLAAWRARKRI